MARTTRDQQREETRRRLFEAAVEVFRRDGIDAARIEDITQLAGVSRGSFYFHYPTKDDVLSELLAQAERHAIDELEGFPEGAPIPAQLGRLAEIIAARWEADPGLFVSVGVVALRRNATDLQAGMPLREVLAARFSDAISREELSSALPADVLADVYLINTFAAGLAWCTRAIAVRSGRETTSAAMLDLPLAAVLSGVVALFLHGAVRVREPSPEAEPS